jgi:hypothetical protein
VLVGQPTQGAQHLVAMEQHAAGALDPRLDDDRGDLAALARKHGVERGLRGGVDRQADDVLRRHDPCEQAVHAFLGVADRHGGQGVAVIAAAEAEEAVLPHDAAVDPEL